MEGNMRPASFLHKVDAALPSLKYYAVTFWWAWNFSGFGGFMWASSPQLEYSHFSTFYLVSSISITLTFFLLANLKISQRLLKSGMFIIFGGLLGSAGTFLLVMIGLDNLSAFLFLALGGATTGIGSAILALKVAEYYGTLSPRESLGFTLRAAATTILVYFVTIGSQLQVGLVIFVCLFLITTTLLLIGNYTEIPENKNPSRYINPSPSIWRFMILIAFTFLVSETERFSFVGTRSAGSLFLVNSVTSVIILIALTACILVISIIRRPFGFGHLYYPFTFVALSIFIISITLDSTNAVFLCITSVAHFIMQSQLFAIFALISYSSKSSPIKVFGMGFGAIGCGSLLGTVMGGQLALIHDVFAFRIIMAIALVGIFIFLITIVFSKKEADKLLAEIPDEDVDTDSAPPLKGIPWKKRCALVGKRYELSPREQEVLELLIKGHGTNFIAEQLVISFYTVRAHTRNIYTKTGAHSREELIGLIDARTSE